MSDSCPKCEGRGWTPYGNGGGCKCSACGGCGKNYRYRKKRRDENKKQEWQDFEAKKERYQALKAAIEQFDPKTNLDHILNDEAKKHLRHLEIDLIASKPR